MEGDASATSMLIPLVVPQKQPFFDPVFGKGKRELSDRRRSSRPAWDRPVSPSHSKAPPLDEQTVSFTTEALEQNEGRHPRSQ